MIVMPDDAPAAKLAATAGYGGEIVTYDRYREDREEIATALALAAGRRVSVPQPRTIAS